MCLRGIAYLPAPSRNNWLDVSAKDMEGHLNRAFSSYRDSVGTM